MELELWGLGLPALTPSIPTVLMPFPKLIINTKMIT